VSSSSTGPSGEWYVALDEGQVGPLAISDIEERWRSSALEGSTLAWKAGMPDWLPLSEIPELGGLVTQPQRARSQPDASPAQAPSADAPQAPARSAATSEAAWQPAAASSLSSLMETELSSAPAAEASRAPSAPAESPGLGGASSGLPGLGGGISPAPGLDLLAGPAPSWSVPLPRPRSRGWVVPVAIVAGVVVAGLLVAVVLLQSRRGSHQPPVASRPVEPATPAQARAATPAPAPAAPTAVTEQAAKSPGGGGAKRKRKGESAREAARGATARGDSGKPGPREPDPAPASASDVKDALGKDDVVGAVKRNAPSIAPCLRDARSKNELQPKQYTFMLEWTINPNGTVAKPRLTGPGEVMSTSLPGCFANAMQRWAFPASRKQTPISNYPLGPIAIH
jgi:hypothetical protein